MPLIPARMKKFQSKMKTLERSQRFSHCKSIGIFFRRSRAANSAIHVRIWQNFKIIRDFVAVLVTCKNEDLIKSDGARVLTTLYIYLSEAQGQLTLQPMVEFG